MSGDGMQAFITAMTGSDGLTSTNLWTEAGYAVPLIVGVAIFSFGFYIVRRVTKGAAKGKVRF